MATITVKGQQYTFVQAPGTNYQPFTLTIDKNEVQCLLAHVPGTGAQGVVPKVWPGNPRIQEEVRRLGLVNPTQTQVKSILEEFNKKDGLSDSLEADGGQCDFLYVWKNQFIEGNRRSLLLVGKAEKILVVIFPDDTSEEVILTFIAKKHLNGPLDWESAMRSMTAWQFKNKHGWTLEKITKHFNFKSVKATKKYIGSYDWLRAAMEIYPSVGLGDWSKFHHAYVPTLERHFEIQGAEHEGFPNIEGRSGLQYKGNFRWFCHLIDKQLVTDCRQSDGVVGPLVRENDGDGIAILNREGAEAAWSYLKAKRKGLVLVVKIKDTIQEIEGVLRSVLKVRERKNDPQFNEEKVQAQLLLLRVQTFMNKVGPIVQDSSAARDVADGL